jgi:class 3 adenylate cyclase
VAGLLHGHGVGSGAILVGEQPPPVVAAAYGAADLFAFPSLTDTQALVLQEAALAGVPVGAGVAVGPAVVGNLAQSANLSVLGDVTNLASRLQSAAGAGEVILAAEAYRRSREWLEGQQIEAERVDLELKGFEGPVTAYRVTTGTVAAVS